MFRPTPPTEGQVVHVRQRNWLVQRIDPGRTERESPLVHLACLDDDNPGDPLQVLWDHEVDARVLADEPEGLSGGSLDDPRMFGAYLHALRWNCVTSTDARLLQAPFRAGIDLKAYQLEPLRKALALPRVNLFIADDVGLGKTIEAGLVMQELLLRQRIDRILVIAPPAVTRQWQEELDQRFGMRFAVYDAAFVAARRRERGWGVNPWATHPTFIVSYALLRGTRGKKGTPHLELLLNALGDRADRSLLILDECHQAAPSHGSLYAIDSRTTRAIRQIARRFEHRLFLSATPHNGHSNSFSALLELLDPQRFTRGVKVQSAKELAPVMVRRLKRHLRAEIDGLPERRLVDHTVDSTPRDPDIVLGELLARYETLYRSALKGLSKREQAARALVCVNLHKRLLSSISAFHRTLEVHARGAEKVLDGAQLTLRPPRHDDADSDATDAERDAAEDEWVDAASVDPGAEARAVLQQMRDLARAHRAEPDPRVRALAGWIRTHLCPMGQWNHRRVVVFTEYDDTLQWLRRTLLQLLPAGAEDRIERYHGGLGEARREAIKSAFNTDPAAHPLRILLATDAAREGINLQAHCADLFHFDLPWNPSRIEQRNGRIDRVLQPKPVIRCHYLVVPHREEDKVLTHLLRKLEVIRDELGSLSEVVSARLAERLEDGLRHLTPDDVDAAATPDQAALEAQKELEGDGAEQLRGDLEILRRQLHRSEKALAYRTEHLAEAVDLGLTIASGEGLAPVTPPTEPETFSLPPLDATWSPVLDSMREPRPDDAPPWNRPPVKPVAFRAAHRLDAPAVQLHLGHPLVQRVLARFRAQGFAAHDLSRVTVVENTRDHLRRVVMYGRLSLFGHGATRLHEALVGVTARVLPDGLKPFAEEAERRAIDDLYDRLAEGPALHPSDLARRQVRDRVKADFATLWPALQEEAERQHAAALDALTTRGQQESEAMAELLHRQRRAIEAAFAEQTQLPLDLDRAAKAERDQFERDRRHMEQRLAELEAELAREPEAIRRGYEVALRRFEPVGIVYLWPRS